MKLSNSKGFSMIEVLIAVFVMAVGVLGVSATQMLSLKNNQSSYYRSQANLLVIDMLDRMRANPEAVFNDGVTSRYANIDTANPPNNPPNCTATCTPAQIAVLDAAEWASHFSSNNASGLIPGSSGTVQTNIVGGVATVTVTVSWSENIWDVDDGGSVKGSKNLSITVRL